MADDYRIRVVRRNKDGTLTFKNGNISISETCWWDPDVVIDAGSYVAYATRMANRDDGTDGGKREGIWFGKGVPVNGGRDTSDEIFIHKGTSAAWSDGCIVMSSAKVYEMWRSINPKEQANVTVTVEDETVKRGRPLDRDCTGRGRGRYQWF